MTNTMTMNTMGTVFSIASVAKIAGTKKDFHAITFLYNGRKMVIGHSKTEGAKFFWYIEGKGNKELSKGEFWKWIKKYDGADARKLAGYAKLMQPVSLGPVVAACGCGRGVDSRTRDYSVRALGTVLCKTCQFTHGDAARQSGRQNVFGVPVFSIEELTQKNQLQLETMVRQIDKAIERVGAYDALVAYREDIMSLLYREIEEHSTDEAIERSDDQREEQLDTDGVKEGSEELIAVLSLLSIPKLKARAEMRGISLRGLKLKAAIIKALVDGGDNLYSREATVSIERPF